MKSEEHMNERYFTIGEIPAKLYEGGRAERALLALHGFGGSKESRAIKLLAQRLCDRDFAVLAIDWRCHGERKCSFSSLTAENCFADMAAASGWLSQNVSDDISVFATSFGGYVTLLDTLSGKTPFRRIALRVPAVNMADSLLSCARASQDNPQGGRDEQNALILEEARSSGFFRVRTGEEFRVPVAAYDMFAGLSAVRAFPALESVPVAVVYAENDELVRRADTERFLELNPAVKSLMIRGCGHRMAESEQALAQALDFAADFLSE